RGLHGVPAPQGGQPVRQGGDPDDPRGRVPPGAGRRLAVGRRTVRVRITAAALAVVGTALVVAAVALVVLLRRFELATVDDQVRMRAGDVVERAQHGGLPPVLASAGRDAVIQVVCDGRVLATSAVVRGPAPLWTFQPGGAEPSL